MKKAWRRLKQLAPYIRTDLAMYIIMVLIILIGVVIIVSR